jgi:dextranase
MFKKLFPLTLILMLLGLSFAYTTPTSAAGPLIQLVNTDKARYNPGNTVTIWVDLRNDTGGSLSGNVSLYFRKLGASAGTDQTQNYSLGNGAATTLTYTWTPPSTDFTGYLIEVWARNSSGGIVDTAATAVDVSSDWSKFPRYGYVSKFDSSVNAWDMIWKMKNYHINAVQFYDWHWQHHRPYNPNASWLEIANRTVLRSKVNDFINASHNYNMLAMNYNLANGAYDNYWSDGSGVQLSWGLFKNADGNYDPSDQDLHPLPTTWATSKIYQFNPANTSWQNYINNEERKVFDNFAFDGWHIDTLGNRGGLWDWNRNPVNLAGTFPSLVNSAKTALNKRMVFNTVSTYGQNEIASSANVDIIYSELWPADGWDTYADFNANADSIRSRTSKGIVFPAYMSKPYSESVSSGFFNDNSVRLTNAAIFASGASHLELGDGEEMLSKEYFPSTPLKMSNSLKEATMDYYHFLVAYQNLLRDGTNTANFRVDLSNVASNTNGSAGGVWKLAKSKSGYQIVHLINLENNFSNQWRDDNANYPTPDTFNNLPMRIYYSGTLGSGAKLWYATPDFEHGKANQLSFTTGSDTGGNYVSFTLPRLQYWDMVWLETNGTGGGINAFNTIQAESFNSQSGISTESTSDTGGGSNVCCTDNGDYVLYNSVNFGSGAGSLDVRVASAISGGTMQFRLGSTSGTIIASVNTPNTGGWQSWQTVNVPVSGASGTQNLYITFSGATNLNWFKFNTGSSGTSAFNTIQAETFNSQSGINTETTSDTGGGQNVCCTDNGDYVVYNNINFGSGAVSLDARVASAVTGGTMQFRLGSTSGTLIATVNTGNTGGWQSWQTRNVTVSGASGTHNLYIVFSGATNLNWFKFNGSSLVSIPNTRANLLSDGGFEMGALWSEKGLTGKDRRVSKHAAEGSYSFRFHRDTPTSKRRQITQRVALTLDAGTTINFAADVKGNALLEGSKLRLKVKYSDGTSESLVVPVPAGTYDYQTLTATLTLTKPITSAQVRISPTLGTLWVDNVLLTTDEAASSSESLLPLP